MNVFNNDDHSLSIETALHRNGILIERARRQGRTLTAEEHSIILAGRAVAVAAKLSRTFVQGAEMDGERDWEMVMDPIRVKVQFAYYTDPYEEIPATASYFITSSNHPALPYHGNVGADQLTAQNIKIPKTPTYEQWVKDGRVCFGG